MAVVAIRTHNVILEPSPFGRDYSLAICCCGWISDPMRTDQEFEDASHLHVHFADSAVIVLEFAG